MSEIFDYGSPWQHRDPDTPLAAQRLNEREQLAADAINDLRTTRDNGIVRAKEINSTGLTSAQIDALFTATPANGTIASDPTNTLLLVRQGGTWHKTAALTNIA